MSDKIIFMGTPNFSVPTLRSLFNSNYKIEAVFTQPPKKKSRGQKIIKSPVHLESIKLNIPVRHPNNLNSEEDLNFIKNLNKEVDRILSKKNLIEKFDIHPDDITISYDFLGERVGDSATLRVEVISVQFDALPSPAFLDLTFAGTTPVATTTTTTTIAPTTTTTSTAPQTQVQNQKVSEQGVENHQLL